MKNKTQIISFFLALLFLVLSFPVSAFADALNIPAVIGGNAGESGTADKDNAGLNYQVGFKDVTSLYDVSELFAKHYNPDIVSANGLKDDNEYTLIVQLDGYSLVQYWELENGKGNFADYAASAAGKAHAEEISADIAAYLAELDEQGIEYEYLWSYDTVLKAVSVRIKGSVANQVASTKGAVVATVSQRYEAPKVVEIENDTNVYATGIYNTADIDDALRGEGMVIAVLDTGLDYTHEAFQMNNFGTDQSKLALTYDQIANILTQEGSGMSAPILTNGLKPSDVFISLKVPYAYDYADKDPDVFPSYSSHGTHVAGIIAGNYTVIPADSPWLEKKNDKELKFTPITDSEGNPTGDYMFEGVVPDAQLVIMKVFTDDVDSESLGGADTEDILMALNDATKLGVDVINMSLGSSAGFSSYADDLESIVMSEVYNAIHAAGISLVCAASNDYSSGYGGVNGTNLTSNPDSATVGSPSTYPAAISIASISGRKSPYILGNGETMVFFTESSDGNSNKRDFMKQMFALAGKDLATDELEVSYVVIGGVGRTYNYSAVASKINQLKSDGKIVVALVARGDTSFEEKMECAMEAGCDAIMVRNNVAGSISMTMGKTEEEYMIPAVSISMDIGQELVDNAVGSVGTLLLSSKFSAGPFMSDFSSWGPTPSLELKPEITSFGGEVTSAVAGGYDVYSGTSMAAPNMAGAVALIRKYVRNLYPDTETFDNVAVNALTYQLMMSTAKIALNEYGDPYSPRKQGAGIADIGATLATPAYVWVKNADGTVSDKTKIELKDSPDRLGVFEMTYYVTNFSGESKTYQLDQFVMTERVSTDGLTVAERAYLFDDCDVTYTVSGDGYYNRGSLIIDGGSTAEVNVKIVLSEADKEYLDSNFENGMYVEGFLTLTDTDSENGVDLSIPYLAFYGDWTDAPMLDYSVFDIADIEQDDSIPDDDKAKISFWATSPYAKYEGDKYIIPIGQYLYTQDETATKVYADTEHAAISMYDEPNGHRTTYSFYAVYAGLLRGAKVCNVKITDYYTGQTVYEDQLINVSKGYANGGSTRPGFVKIEFNPYEAGLPNNGHYLFEMEAYLDYGDGTKGNSNSFSFSFYTDYESPVLNDVQLRFVTQKEDEEDVTHIYLDVFTYDNHFTQAILLCYLNEENNEIELATEYVTPVYSSTIGSVTKTTIEITDLYWEYFDNLYVQVEDYAMNYTLFSLDLTSSIVFPETVDFEESEITVRPNEAIKPVLNVTPSDAQTYDLIWRSMDKSVAKAQNGEIFGVGEGTTYVYVYSSKNDIIAVPRARIKVTVEGEKLTESIAPKTVYLNGFLDMHYRPVDPTNTTVEVRPNIDIPLSIKTDPWYADEISFKWTTSNPLVATVDENTGLVHTLKKGTAIIKAESGIYSVYVRLTVSEEYDIRNYTLYGYYGPGGEVVVPDKFNFMYIDEEALMDNDKITSFTVPEGVTEIRKNAFKNCKNLKKIVLPSTLTYIEESAFEGCTALEEIDISASLSLIIGRRCFYGCTSLNKITADARGNRITAAWDYAFAGCSSLKEYDATNLCQGGSYIFANCTSLENVTFSENTRIGTGMFFNCSAMTELTLPVTNIGDAAFEGCAGLSSLTLNADLINIGKEAFRDCTNLRQIAFNGTDVNIGDKAFASCGVRVLTLPNGRVSIGEGAFRECVALYRVRLNQDTKITLTGSAPFYKCDLFNEFYLYRTSAGEDIKTTTTKYYKTDGNILYNTSGDTLVLVPNALKINGFSIPATVRNIGNNAFCGHLELTGIDLSGIETIGMYAFETTGISGELIIPSGVKSIGEGAFRNCVELTSVRFADGSALDEIPALCFADTSKLQSAYLPVGLIKIGNSSFARSLVSAITSNDEVSVIANTFDGISFPYLTFIEDMAFAEANFVTVNLPSTLKYVGRASFAYEPMLSYVYFTDGVEGLVLDEGVFYDSMHLIEIVLPEGLTAISPYLLAGRVERPALTSVTLPSTLETIGEYAFYECTGLKEINLADTKVTVLPAYSFYGCEKLEDIDLSEIVRFGEASFAFNKAITELNLSAKTTEIGDRAFYGCAVRKVTMAGVKNIGMEAFMESDLVEVTIPASVEYIGHGAFCYNHALTHIIMPEASENYFVDCLKDGDTVLEYGVLYSVLPSGAYQLECFPGGLEWKSYEVLPGTIRIGTEAFEGVLGLGEVHLPASLKTIGPKAFYDTFLKQFYFNGVNAPILECDYVNGNEYAQDDWAYKVFSRDGGAGLEQYYANFFYYSAYAAYSGSDFGLVLYSPVNGFGYTSPIWTDFFGDGYLTEEVADNNTINAANAIGALLDVQTILDMDENDFIAYAVVIRKARNLFDAVLPGRQMQYIRADYDGRNYEQILLDAESASRTKKDEFGIENPIVEIEISTNPNKLSYVEREAFDTTGMVVTAVYADASRAELTDYTLSKNIAYKGDKYLTVVHGDNTASVRVEISASSNTTVPATAETDAVISGVQALPSVDAVLAMSKTDVITYSVQVRVLRETLDGITDQAQLALIAGDFNGTDYAQRLADVEAALRTKKEEYSIENAETGIVLVGALNKTLYKIGEAYTLDGIKVYVVYEDGSRAEVTDYTLSKTVAEEGDTALTVSYHNFTAEVAVSVSKLPPVVSDTLYIVLTVVGSVLLCGGVGFGIWWFLLQRKKRLK